jgi:hypothetical protein
MFLIPLIVFPFIVSMAVYRLYQLPRRYFLGTIRLTHPGLSLRSTLTVVAYLGLLAYTVGVALLVIQTLLGGLSTLASWLDVAPALAAYPIVYIAAEWVFFYGFQASPET